MIQRYSFSFDYNEDLEMERSVRKIHKYIVGIFSFETFYIERYIQRYFTHHKDFKDKYKNVEKDQKIIELNTIAYKKKIVLLNMIAHALCLAIQQINMKIFYPYEELKEPIKYWKSFLPLQMNLKNISLE